MSPSSYLMSYLPVLRPTFRFHIWPRNHVPAPLKCASIFSYRRYEGTWCRFLFRRSSTVLLPLKPKGRALTWNTPTASRLTSGPPSIETGMRTRYVLRFRPELGVGVTHPCRSNPDATVFLYSGVILKVLD